MKFIIGTIAIFYTLWVSGSPCFGQEYSEILDELLVAADINERPLRIEARPIIICYVWDYEHQKPAAETVDEAYSRWKDFSYLVHIADSDAEALRHWASRRNGIVLSPWDAKKFQAKIGDKALPYALFFISDNRGRLDGARLIEGSRVGNVKAGIRQAVRQHYERIEVEDLSSRLKWLGYLEPLEETTLPDERWKVVNTRFSGQNGYLPASEHPQAEMREKLATDLPILTELVIDEVRGTARTEADYNSLGIIFFLQDRLEDAVKSFDLAQVKAQIKDTSDRYRYNLAITYAVMKNNAFALQQLRYCTPGPLTDRYRRAVNAIIGDQREIGGAEPLLGDTLLHRRSSMATGFVLIGAASMAVVLQPSTSTKDSYEDYRSTERTGDMLSLTAGNLALNASLFGIQGVSGRKTTSKWIFYGKGAAFTAGGILNWLVLEQANARRELGKGQPDQQVAARAKHKAAQATTRWLLINGALDIALGVLTSELLDNHEGTVDMVWDPTSDQPDILTVEMLDMRIEPNTFTVIYNRRF